MSNKKFLRSCEYSPDTINAHARTCQPRTNADESYYGNEEHPEPEEHVDLLVVPEEIKIYGIMGDANQKNWALEFMSSLKGPTKRLCTGPRYWLTMILAKFVTHH